MFEQWWGKGADMELKEKAEQRRRKGAETVERRWGNGREKAE